MNNNNPIFHTVVVTLQELSTAPVTSVVAGRALQRGQRNRSGGGHLLLNEFIYSGATCCFLCLAERNACSICMAVPNGYHVENCHVRGWLYKLLAKAAVSLQGTPSHHSPFYGSGRAYSAAGACGFAL